MKRILIVIEIDIDESFEMPDWYNGKNNEEIENFCNDKVFDFVSNVLELDFGLGRETLNYTQVEEWDDE